MHLKAALSAVCLGVLVAGVLAQVPDRTTFEVASIKRNTSGPPRSGGPDPTGRFSVRYATVSTLLQFAYHLRGDAQVVGSDGWTRSERYDIEATTGGPATRDEKATMMQQLLDERFHLQVHHDTHELPVLELRIARSDGALGERLTHATDEDADCSQSPAAMVMTPIVPGGPPVPPCGGHFTPTSFYMRGMTMEEFAEQLDVWQLGPMVVDHTGLAGKFNMALEWTNEGGSLQPSAIITPLLDQLGLKLVSARDQIDVLVIDHVEHPTED